MLKPFSLLLVLILLGCSTDSETSTEHINPILSKDYVQSDSTSEITELEDLVDGAEEVVLFDEKDLSNLTKDEEIVYNNPFTQQLFLRNYTEVKPGNLYIEIPFDLHGMDCGAPDCYTTTLSFNLELTHQVVFPEYLSFQLKETGCIPEEWTKNDVFHLENKKNQEIIYYSEKLRYTFVMFSDITSVYLFPNTEKDKITSKTARNFDDENDAPYQSRGLLFDY